MLTYWDSSDLLKCHQHSFFSQQDATIINIKSPTSLTSNKYLPTVDRLSLIRTDRDFLASVGKPLWKYWVGWDRVDPSSEIQIIRIYHRSNRNGSNYLMDFNLVFKYHSMKQHWYNTQFGYQFGWHMKIFCDFRPVLRESSKSWLCSDEIGNWHSV